MTNMNPMFPWAEQLREAMLRGGVDIGGMPVNDAMQVVVGRIRTLTEQLEAARRDAGEASTKWQPIETAPRDGTWLMCWSGEYGATPRMWVDDPSEGYIGWVEASCRWGGTLFEGYNETDDQPTHWMPLPEPPMESPQCP